MVLACSRQVGKSTFIRINMHYEALKDKGNSLLYTTITEKLLEDFRHRKLPQLFSNRSNGDNRFDIVTEINNKKMIKLSNGSFIYFRAIGSAPESALGITARKIFFDEVQSLNPESIATALECSASFQDNSSFVYCGTPISLLDPLWSIYESSTKHEWIIKCPKCHKELEPLGIENIDVTRPYLFCLKCSGKVDPLLGRWQQTNPDSDKFGYRINRLMDPDASWSNPQGSGILDLYKRYSPHQFNNYVLGLPSETGKNILSEKEILACCEDYEFFDILDVKPWSKMNYLVMAIDWAYNMDDGGSSFTTYALADNFNGKIWIRYAKRFDDPMITPDDIIAEISSVANRLPVKVILSDHGVGHLENKRLRSIIGKMVIEVIYSGESEIGTWQPKHNRYLLGRTRSLDTTINAIRQRKFAFPRHETINPFLGDLLHTQRVVDAEGCNPRYLKPSNSPDDFLHLLNYINAGIRNLMSYLVF